MKRTPAIVSAAKQFLANGCELIVVHRDQKNPVGDKWTTRPPAPVAELKEAVNNGYNLGLRLKETQLLIDVDVKKGAAGDMSWKRLVKDVPALGHMEYLTRTPSTGYHYLFTLPPGTNGIDLPTHHGRYPGLEFFSKGRQVLIGGSTVDGVPYVMNEAWEWPAPLAPELLLRRLTEDKAKVRDADESAVSKGWGLLVGLELEEYLDRIDVLAYRRHEEWFQFMCACHFITAGEGEQEFLDWSTGDPQFAGHREHIEKRWASLSEGRDRRPITGLTFVMHLREAGLNTEADALRAKIAFSSTEFTNLQTPDERMAAIEAERTRFMGDIDRAPDELTLYKVLDLMAQSTLIGNEPMLESELLDAIQSKNRRMRVTDMRKSLKNRRMELQSNLEDANEEFTRDSYLRICAQRIVSAGGTDSMVYSEGRLWDWRVSQGCYREYDEITAKNRIDNWLMRNNLTIDLRTLNEVYQLLCIVSAKSNSFWNIQQIDEGRMLNCRNGELWLRSGEWVLEPHNMHHRRRSVLPVSYQPENTPEPHRFLEFIDSAFEPAHIENIKRKLACGFIYTMADGLPWLKKAWLLLGPPNTGKSRLIEVVQNLVGEENAASLSIHQMGTRFWTSRLVGKLANVNAEISTKAGVATDVLKALVSGDPISVEEKNMPAFEFVNRSVFWFAGNDLPDFKGGSAGILERLCIIQFESALSADRRTHKLKEWLALETEAIFHWALPIYLEEYEKDRCASILMNIDDGSDDMTNVTAKVEPHIAWMRECLEFTDEHEDAVLVDDVFRSYSEWQTKYPGDAPYIPTLRGFGMRWSGWLRQKEGFRIHKSRDLEQRYLYHGIRLRRPEKYDF